MEKLCWQPSYCIGIEEIDLQHQHLLKLINRIIDYIEMQQTGEVICAIFDELIDYTMLHFASEEKYFFQLSKDDRTLHRLQHSHFAEELHRLKVSTIKQKHATKILFFLTDWFIHHILSEDKKLIGSQ
ncbi:bacteriohemerythrin [Colwellia sp. MEBiC06753]